MKKYLLLSAAVCIVATVTAQKTVPSAAAKKSFEQKYADATKTSWEKEGKDYEVNFTQGSNKMSAVFDKAGAWKETEEVVAATDLPAAVTTYVQTHYKGTPIKRAEKITKANGNINYEVAIGKKEYIFDASGKMIEQEKE
ncbi:MAG: PepSY-like domain-containing protein [Ferruginibacter sp.]